MQTNSFTLGHCQIKKCTPSKLAKNGFLGITFFSGNRGKLKIAYGMKNIMRNNMGLKKNSKSLKWPCYIQFVVLPKKVVLDWTIEVIKLNKMFRTTLEMLVQLVDDKRSTLVGSTNWTNISRVVLNILLSLITSMVQSRTT